MQFAVAPEHRKFFNKNHYIAFEDLISPSKTDDLLKHADTVLAKNLECTVTNLPAQKADDLYLKGRDLWRKDPFIKKIVLERSFGEIASDLFFAKPVRMGYDQYIHQGKTSFHFAHRLNEISSLDSICGGVIIQLTDLPSHPALPAKKGSALFVSPTFFIDMDIISPHLLIVYAKQECRYFPSPHDQISNHFKRVVGYNSGEVLVNAKNPIIFS